MKKQDLAKKMFLSLVALKAVETRKLRARAAKAVASRRANKRSAAAYKAWETRRAA